ncbi:hypothetical protein PHMEG_00014699 [Phytophthora megakarya]|uniref:Uncharacterized protein n=1 Tax=Phytophthora megakarya TaxID=4795 RepID=A0A225W5N0_9STRA|nr:hypothetical protein PHMEG_00014699 [Phytophthora megakarya]
MLKFAIWLPPQTNLHSYQLVLFGVHYYQFRWNTEIKGKAASMSSPNPYTYRGIIVLALDTQSDSQTDTNLPSTACVATILEVQENHPPHSPYYAQCTNPLTSANPTIVSEYLAVGQKVYEFILTRADITCFDNKGNPCYIYDKITEAKVKFRS